MKVKIETITPAAAREMLKQNSQNRTVRQKHVDFLAAEMTNGRWQTTSETIAFSTDGVIVDGQHRLLAIVQSNTAVEVLVARDVSMGTQDVIDCGSARTVADQLHLSDGVTNANLVAAAARQIVSLCCYYQNPKMSVATTRFVLAEYGKEIDAAIESIGNFKPGRKGWIIGALAFAYNADRSVGKFIEAFGSGEGLIRGNPVKAARDWLVNGNGEALKKKFTKSRIEGLLNAAYNHSVGSQLITIRGGSQGVDFFTSKNRRSVATIREQMKHLLA